MFIKFAVDIRHETRRTLSERVAIPLFISETTLNLQGKLVPNSRLKHLDVKIVSLFQHSSAKNVYPIRSDIYQPIDKIG